MLTEARNQHPDVPVVLMTAQASLQSAIQAVNQARRCLPGRLGRPLPAGAGRDGRPRVPGREGRRSVPGRERRSALAAARRLLAWAAFSRFSPSR